MFWPRVVHYNYWPLAKIVRIVVLSRIFPRHRIILGPAKKAGSGRVKKFVKNEIGREREQLFLIKKTFIPKNSQRQTEHG